MPIHIVVAGILGALMLIVGHFWLVIVAFRTSIVWGLVTLFIPFWGSLIFMAIHWRRSVKPFFLYLGGLACIGSAVLFVMALSPEQLKAIDSKSDSAESTADEKPPVNKEPLTHKKSPAAKRP